MSASVSHRALRVFHNLDCWSEDLHNQTYRKASLFQKGRWTKKLCLSPWYIWYHFFPIFLFFSDFIKKGKELKIQWSVIVAVIFVIKHQWQNRVLYLLCISTGYCVKDKACRCDSFFSWWTVSRSCGELSHLDVCPLVFFCPYLPLDGAPSK